MQFNIYSFLKLRFLSLHVATLPEFPPPRGTPRGRSPRTGWGSSRGGGRGPFQRWSTPDRPSWNRWQAGDSRGTADDDPEREPWIQMPPSKMMTSKEKEWIMRIAMMSLLSGDPYISDYYFIVSQINFISFRQAHHDVAIGIIVVYLFLRICTLVLVDSCSACAAIYHVLVMHFDMHVLVMSCHVVSCRVKFCNVMSFVLKVVGGLLTNKVKRCRNH